MVQVECTLHLPALSRSQYAARGLLDTGGKPLGGIWRSTFATVASRPGDNAPIEVLMAPGERAGVPNGKKGDGRRCSFLGVRWAPCNSPSPGAAFPPPYADTRTDLDRVSLAGVRDRRFVRTAREARVLAARRGIGRQRLPRWTAGGEALVTERARVEAISFISCRTVCVPPRSVRPSVQRETTCTLFFSSLLRFPFSALVAESCYRRRWRERLSSHLPGDGATPIGAVLFSPDVICLGRPFNHGTGRRLFGCRHTGPVGHVVSGVII